MTRSIKILSFLAGVAAMALTTSSSKALDLQFSFVNDAGSGTTFGATVTGSVKGLNPDPISGWSFSPVTVTFDSVSTGFDPGFSADSWIDFGTFHLTAGNIPDYASFSHNDGTEAVDLELNSRGLVFLSDYSKFYQNGEGNITWTPIVSTPSAVPDSTSSLGLMVAGAAGLMLFGRRVKQA